MKLRKKEKLRHLILGVIFSLNSVFLIFTAIFFVKTLKDRPLEVALNKEKVSKPEEKIEKPAPAAEGPAIVNIDSSPQGAKIFINGYFKGRTPYKLKIVSVSSSPKTFHIKLLLPGYRSWQIYEDFKQGDVKELSITLKPEKQTK